MVKLYAVVIQYVPSRRDEALPDLCSTSRLRVLLAPGPLLAPLPQGLPTLHRYVSQE
jgi:hypothetical protein